MGIGRSIAYQYELPQGGLAQDQLAGAGGGIRGGLSQQGAAMGGGGDMIPVPEGLQWVDDNTSDIYQRWGNLNSLAKSLKTQFGVDVTNPDYTDPQQVKIAQAFQKGVADLYMNIDRYKNDQKMLESMVARGQQFRVDPSKAPLSENLWEATVRPIEEETLQVLDDFQRSYSDINTAEAATQNLTEYRDTLIDRRNATTNQAEREMLDKSIATIKGALYDATADRDRMEKFRARMQKDNTAASQADTFWQVVKDSQERKDTRVYLSFINRSTGKPMFKSATPPDELGNFELTLAPAQFIHPETGVKMTIDETPIQANLYDDATFMQLGDYMRNFGGMDELNWDVLSRSPSRSKALEVAPPNKTQQELAQEFGTTKQSIGEVEKVYADVGAEGRSEYFYNLSQDLDSIAKTGELKLVAGIPRRDLVYGAGPNSPVKKKHIKEGQESIGTETIYKVDALHGGLNLYTRDDQNEEVIFYLPTDGTSIQNLGSQGRYGELMSALLRKAGVGTEKLQTGTKSDTEENNGGVKTFDIPKRVRDKKTGEIYDVDPGSEIPTDLFEILE